MVMVVVVGVVVESSAEDFGGMACSGRVGTGGQMQGAEELR